MTATFKTNGKPPIPGALKSQKPKLLQIPGIVAISLYMLLLALEVILFVARGKFSPIFLLFSVLFIAAGLGLLKLLRWAWALTLAAVAMLAGLFLWNYTNQHLVVPLAYGLLNLIIFLYLVRTEIRNKFH